MAILLNLVKHSVPRLFLLRLSMPPTATHQQDNSYGCSAIWRVSKFVIPLIMRNSVLFVFHFDLLFVIHLDDIIEISSELI